MFCPKWCLQKSILFRVSHKYVIILGKYCQFSNYCRTHFFWKLWSSERDHTQTATTEREGGGRGYAKFQLGKNGPAPLAQCTGGRVNLNFLVPPYGVPFLNPWNMPNKIWASLNSKIKFWNSLHKLVVWKGELILIFGSKITNFGPFFTIAPKFHSKFSQKFKNRGLKNFGQKMTKNMLVSGP